MCFKKMQDINLYIPNNKEVKIHCYCEKSVSSLQEDFTVIARKQNTPSLRK